MSRVGKVPITVPEGVSVNIEGQRVVVTGPKGELSWNVHPVINVELEDSTLVCSIGRQTKQSRALWGTTRAVLQNLVTGVAEGFRKQLELHGVGYRASVKGKDLELIVGFSHPVVVSAPEGITFTVEKEVVTVEGINAKEVGQVASDIRAVRPPEPYKGKGIRYAGENVRRKVGKVMGSAAG